MIVRIILYSALLALVFNDYRKNRKKFTLKIVPVVLLSFFGTTEYFINLDERLQILIVVVTVGLAINTLYSYYKDYKLMRYRIMKEKREQREAELAKKGQ